MLLGIAVGLGFPRYARYCVAFIVAVAAVLEALQLIVPGRDGRFDDMLVKVAAGVAAIALTKLVMIVRSRVRPDIELEKDLQKENA